MGKISAVYKIVNTVTGEFYVGSSKDVMRRWAQHRRPSTWKAKPNSLLYKAMQEYGVDKFRFQILAPVMEEYLTQVEQELIDMLKPTYNQMNANGIDVEHHIEYMKSYLTEYRQSDKYKDARKEYNKKYRESDKGRTVDKEYRQSDRGRASHRKSNKKYFHQLCEYNGETLTLRALSTRFSKAGISHPVLEAKKYLKQK